MFEMMVFFGGLWVFDVNVDGVLYGVFIENLGILLNDFFVILLDMGVKW